MKSFSKYEEGSEKPMYTNRNALRTLRTKTNGEDWEDTFYHTEVHKE
jgi:hypothetical protein